MRKILIFILLLSGVVFGQRPIRWIDLLQSTRDSISAGWEQGVSDSLAAERIARDQAIVDSLYSNRVQMVAYDSTTFQNIIDNIKTDNFLCTISGNISFSKNDTVPANIFLNFVPGGQINIPLGDTLWISGTWYAGRYTIFPGAGEILGNNSSMDMFFPEWFGVKATITTDYNALYTQELQKTFLTASNFHGHNTISLQSNRVYTTDSLWIKGDLSIKAEGIGFAILSAGRNPADTVFVWGSDSSPWEDIKNTPGLMTQCGAENIYFKGAKSVSSGESVLLYLRKPALGAYLINTQVWSSDGIGLYIDTPNAGPRLDNVWLDTNDSEGLYVSGGSGVTAGALYVEQNGVAGQTPAIRIKSNHLYISDLHIEDSSVNDTIIYDSGYGTIIGRIWVSAQSTTALNKYYYYGKGKIGSIYRYSGNDTSSSVLKSNTANIPFRFLGQHSDPQNIRFLWSFGADAVSGVLGIGPAWKSSLGGTDDLEVVPHDTVIGKGGNWLGYDALFNRLLTAPGVDSDYYTNYITPLWSINPIDGKVYNLVERTTTIVSQDTLINFTGATTTKDSLDKVIIYITDIVKRLRSYK